MSNQLTMREFLESSPPNRRESISDLSLIHSPNTSWKKVLSAPEIQLHCPNDVCDGARVFRSISDHGDNKIFLTEWASGNQVVETTNELVHLVYYCWNCQIEKKVFSLSLEVSKDKSDGSGSVEKLGESPAFGPNTPSRLITLVGSDRELFLKGRRCESQGLGVGAFAYYRRVVEDQKNRILDQILKASNLLDVPLSTIQLLEAAKQERQFKKAVDDVKDVIPQALLIRGHNPLILLHSALSAGLHSHTDDQCLQIAKSIRVVLAELSDRLAQVLKDDAEVKQALTQLLNPRVDGER